MQHEVNAARFSILNVARSAIHPQRLGVVLGQLARHAVRRRGRLSDAANRSWLAANSVALDEFAARLDPGLWQESVAFSQRLDASAREVEERSGFSPYGGAADAFLHFLTRYLQPGIIVETGVAAGYSSCAFLTAIRANGRGRLYSSDFPNLRLRDPEKYIGVLVPPPLKQDWSLFLDGDAANLPAILDTITAPIDLFHYDSDKSYAGREFALSLVRDRMAAGGVSLIDDIEDNSHFHDLATSGVASRWRVFRCWGKYVGMIGEPERPG